jgi:hypothetical protein
MPRVVEDFIRGPRLDNVGRLHHRDAVAHMADDPKIVGNEQHRQIEPRLQRGEKIEHLTVERIIEQPLRLRGDLDRATPNFGGEPGVGLRPQRAQCGARARPAVAAGP